MLKDKWLLLPVGELSEWAESGIVVFMVPVTERYVEWVEKLHKAAQTLPTNLSIRYIGAMDYWAIPMSKYGDDEETREMILDLWETTGGTDNEPSFVQIARHVDLEEARGHTNIHVSADGNLYWEFYPKYGIQTWHGWTSIKDLRRELDSPNGEEETQANG